MTLPPTLDVAALVAGHLDALGIRYSIGGSLASSFSGEPRSTLDVDIVVDLEESAVAGLVSALGPGFYADEDALRRAARSRGSANIIHLATSIKVDFFVMGGTALDRDILDRRVIAAVGGPPPVRLFVHTPEDILLQKLRWYRRGGETSDRQWRDVLGIIRAQRGRLDHGYLERGSQRLDVTDLLGLAIEESER